MKRNPLPWLIGLVALGLLAYFGLRPKPVAVDLGEVTEGPMMVTIDEDGETRIREPYVISAPLAGRLLRVQLEPGDAIRKEQVISAIDPSIPGLLDARSEAEAEARVSATEAAYRRAESQLEIARADTDQAERYYERDLGRLERGNISDATLEDTEHALRIARGNLAAAQSSLEIARFDREQARAALLYSKSLSGDPGESERHFEIGSPIDGVVLRRFQESSTIIPAGERILEIGNPQDLEIRIDVLSQDAVRIQPGQRIIIEHWGGPQNLTAWVRRIEPSAFTKVSALGVDEQRVWVYGDFAEAGESSSPVIEPGAASPVPESSVAGLGDAYRVEARIVTWERDRVLRIPAGALFRENNDTRHWAVFRVTPRGTAERIRIQIGERNDQVAELLSGLDAGDRVVLHPGDQVEEGTRLESRGKP